MMLIVLNEALRAQAFPWNTQLPPWERAESTQASGLCEDDSPCCSVCAQPIAPEDRAHAGMQLQSTDQTGFRRYAQLHDSPSRISDDTT